VVIRITDPDPGKTCLGGGTHCPSTSSLECIVRVDNLVLAYAEWDRILSSRTVFDLENDSKMKKSWLLASKTTSLALSLVHAVLEPVPELMKSVHETRKFARNRDGTMRDRFDARGVLLEASSGLGRCSSVDCSSTIQESLIAHRQPQQPTLPSTRPPAAQQVRATSPRAQFYDHTRYYTIMNSFLT